MEDRFNIWNDIKKEINKKNKIIYFHEREIWFISMWKNIWFEQDGKGEFFWRPVIVLKKFNNHVFYWIPLTSKNKNWKYYYNFNFKWVENNAIISQIRLYDSKRLLEKKWKVNKLDYKEIKKQIRELFE